MEELLKWYCKNKLPASQMVWEKLTVVESNKARISTTFFGARDLPIVGFYKNITKSLPLDEMDTKI